MQLLVVRHAIAEEAADWARRGRPDSERPLTAKGRALMKKNAGGIRAACRGLNAIASSPFVRAMQTAEVLAEAYGETRIVTVGALASGGSREELARWLQGRDDEETLALVGHEPDLGELVAWLVGGRGMKALPMKKGGACLVRFAGHPVAGQGELKWFLPPSMLRRYD